jgi:hypothetical protein
VKGIATAIWLLALSITTGGLVDNEQWGAALVISLLLWFSVRAVLRRLSDKEVL